MRQELPDSRSDLEARPATRDVRSVEHPHTLRIEIAIDYSYNPEYESQCGRSQEYASQVDQGGRKRRICDDLPARNAGGGHRPDDEGRSREAEVRDIEGQGDGSRFRLVEADDQR